MKDLDNVHSRLVDKLGRLIAKGKWAKNGFLPREDDLVAEFSVSRTIVREATKTLQALPSIEIRLPARRSVSVQAKDVNWLP